MVDVPAPGRVVAGWVWETMADVVGRPLLLASLSVIPEMLHSVCSLLLVAVLLRQGARLDVLDADFQAYTKDG